MPVAYVYMAQDVMILMRATHWKGWTLKTKTFLGPEMATSKASAIWAQKSRQQVEVNLNQN
jgi:hypothetical protein